MASFPEKVQAPTQYGERLKAQIAYLSVYQLIPQARLAELIQDFYGQPISKALIQLILAELSVQVEPSLVAIRAELVQAAVAHADETGVRVAGLTHWWHVFATPYLTYYSVHPKRGQIALRAGGLLDPFQGCLVHDAFASYFVFDHCQHALCNAHLLRELTFIFEELTQPWAGNLKNLLLDIKTASRVAQALGHTQFTAEQIIQFTQTYADLVYCGWQANPLPDPPTAKKRGRVKHSTPQNLLRRLEKYPALILAFMHDFRIPFDNNLAERDLRMVKVQQKISGCFRTQAGAEMFARTRSYISTARKQGLNVLQPITDALAGRPFIPTLT
jgi:transposase